tara:strand:+ start:282 stop:530 length:249 start_codon:yes stop_codon:yes gene_type:complete
MKEYKYPFYVELERFGVIGGFNSQEEARSYINHQVNIVIDEKDKKGRKEFKKEHSILTLNEFKNYTGYIVNDLDENSKLLIY